MAKAGERPWPTEIRLAGQGKLLRVTFDTGETFDLSAELLRVESPSAEVKGHAPDQAVTVPGKRDVSITRIEEVGNYAVRLLFSDGHSTGIYTWDYLLKLGRERETVCQAYLEKLGSEGLSRG
jgi:DUF971 family protein